MSQQGWYLTLTPITFHRCRWHRTPGDMLYRLAAGKTQHIECRNGGLPNETHGFKCFFFRHILRPFVRPVNESITDVTGTAVVTVETDVHSPAVFSAICKLLPLRLTKPISSKGMWNTERLISSCITMLSCISIDILKKKLKFSNHFYVAC